MLNSRTMKKQNLLLLLGLFIARFSFSQAGVGCPQGSIVGLSDTVIMNTSVTYGVSVVNTGNVALSGPVTVYIGNIDSTATFHLVDSVITQFTLFPFNPGDTQSVLITHTIDPAKFYEGNNTVVIWPVHGSAVTTDTASKNIFVIIFSSTEELTMEKLIIYPNPVKDALRIVANETIEQVRIFDLSGQLVQTAVFPENLDVSSLPAGIYCIEARSVNQKSKRIKFVKQ